MNKVSFTLWRALVLSPLMLSLAPAATKPAATKPAAATPQKLKEVVVQDVTPEDSILPTSRPLSSVYGSDLSVLDTPRSVGTITKEQVQEYGDLSINRVNQYASGLSNQAGYGVEGIPFIRGDLGEVYQNGMRRANNRNGFPVNFNRVDAVDIVKGPAGAVYGPAYNGGGYVNFVTKQPYFDKEHVEISSDLGSYVPGGASYENFAYTVDAGGPIIKNKLAYRFSFNQKIADSYYQYAHDDELDVFTAFTYTPTPELSFDFNAGFFTSNFTEVGGTNRPTQELIDHGTYTTGPAQQGPYGGTYGYVVPSATAGKSKIYGYNTNFTLGSGARAKDYTFQLTSTYHADPDFTLVNRAFFEDFERQDIEYTYYVEVLPYSRVFEDRTEAQVKFETPLLGLNLEHNTNAGISYRMEQVKAYNSYNLEALSAYDLTQPLSARTVFSFIPGQTLPSSSPLEIQIPGSGAFGEPSTVSPTFGNYSQPNTKVSNLYTLAVFDQHDIKINDQWRYFIGGRVNVDFVDAHDPLPPSDVPAARDSTTQTQTSFNTSLSYKPVSQVTTYVTYNRSNLIAIGGVGGLNFPGYLQGSDFHALSELYEGGAKFDVIPNKLVASVTGFFQKRTVGSLVGATNTIETRGVETDVTYEMNKNFNLFANLTWMEANYVDLVPGVAASPAGFATDRNLGDFNGFVGLPMGNYRVLGVPKIVFNAYATYQLDNGLGARVGPHVESSQPLDFANTTVIPAQFYWNATLFYKQPRWEVAVDFQNFTDERNWTPSDTEFTAGDLALQSLPFNVQGHVKIRF